LYFRFADFEIDIARHELRRAGTAVHIEPQVFDLLVHLIRHRDRIVGKDELFDVVWEGRIVSEATLSSRIIAARRALRDNGNDQSLIRTVFKRGFRFVGDVTEVSATERAASPQRAPADAALLAAEPLALPDTPLVEAPPFQHMGLGPDQERPADGDALSHPGRGADPLPAVLAPAGRRSARTPLIAAALLGLVALPAAAWWLLSSAPLPAPIVKDAVALAREPEAAPDRLAAAVASIVVLPFINLSGDAAQDYVADGVTDSLTEQKASGLVQDLIKAEQRTRLQVLTAPVDGVVQQLAIHTVGGVVTPAQSLLVVVPSDSRLEIEAMVSNSDIGFVHAGQEAEIKVDTFNFTRYGLLHGEVLSVSQDAIIRDQSERGNDRRPGSPTDSSEPKGQELSYSARISLDRSRMQIDDRMVSLSPGMAVTVEIKTGSRMILSYLLSPLLRYRQESLRER
jgi:DNA-binding winged helix-turn-helix (wHTH) protein